MYRKVLRLYQRKSETNKIIILSQNIEISIIKCSYTLKTLYHKIVFVSKKKLNKLTKMEYLRLQLYTLRTMCVPIVTQTVMTNAKILDRIYLFFIWFNSELHSKCINFNKVYWINLSFFCFLCYIKTFEYLHISMNSNPLFVPDGFVQGVIISKLFHSLT